MGQQGSSVAEEIQAVAAILRSWGTVYLHRARRRLPEDRTIGQLDQRLATELTTTADRLEALLQAQG